MGIKQKFTLLICLFSFVFSGLPAMSDEVEQLVAGVLPVLDAGQAKLAEAQECDPPAWLRCQEYLLARMTLHLVDGQWVEVTETPEAEESEVAEATEDPQVAKAVSLAIEVGTQVNEVVEDQPAAPETTVEPAGDLITFPEESQEEGDQG